MVQATGLALFLKKKIIWSNVGEWLFCRVCSKSWQL